MQFTDLYFLFIFFPLFLAVYYLMKPKYREFLFLLGSILLWIFSSWDSLVLLGAAALLNIAIGNLMIGFREKGRNIGCKVGLITGIVLDTAVLGYYKYSDFILLNLNKLTGTGFEIIEKLLPLGISFFTFKVIAYLADIYRGKISERGVIRPLLYFFCFAQMQSGPVSRYEDFRTENYKTKPEFSAGATRFMIGFSQKVILANVLNNITSEVYDGTAEISTPLIWLASICYSLQLYYDFAGYSNMAIGICNILGYHCPENFRDPYCTPSVSGFWRRWHITLGTWFRDYIYIPMGGSRVGKGRLCFNLFAVWFLTGLWHGAGWRFIAWGLGYFIVILLEKLFDLPGRFHSGWAKAGYRILTLLFINVQWVLFRSNSMGQALQYIKTMFVYRNDGLANERALFLIGDYAWVILAAIFFATSLPRNIRSAAEKRKGTKVCYDAVYAVAVIGFFLLALSFVIGGQNNPFLYANF